MVEKSSWDHANVRQKLGLVLRNRKKISQIIKDYCYLPFFLLIILWNEACTMYNVRVHVREWNKIKPYKQYELKLGFYW